MEYFQAKMLQTAKERLFELVFYASHGRLSSNTLTP
jgi:hypothetical protein